MCVHLKGRYVAWGCDVLSGMSVFLVLSAYSSFELRGGVGGNRVSSTLDYKIPAHTFIVVGMKLPIKHKHRCMHFYGSACLHFY